MSSADPLTTITVGLAAVTLVLLGVGTGSAWLAPTGRTSRPTLTAVATLTIGAVLAAITVLAARLPASLATAAALTTAVGAGLVARGLFELRARARTRRMHSTYQPAYTSRAAQLATPTPTITNGPTASTAESETWEGVR